MHVAVKNQIKQIRGTILSKVTFNIYFSFIHCLFLLLCVTVFVTLCVYQIVCHYFQSQEDLTLADLEPEELAKPSSKASKSKKQESCSSAKPPETQFLYKSESLWNDTFPEKLKEMNSVKHSEVILTQNKTDDSSDRRSQSPEAINYAFKGSNGDLRKPATEKQPNGIHHNSPKRTPSIKSETKNTKLSLSSSFSRKKQQDGEPLVNSTRKDSLSKSKSSSREFNQVELNAFDNPAMAGTVGLLSQEEESSSSSNSSPAHKPLLKEPIRQTMEREGVVFHQPSFEGEDGYRTAELQPLESSQSEVNINSLIIHIVFKNTLLFCYIALIKSQVSRYSKIRLQRTHL